MKGKISTERRVDHFKHKSVDPLSLSEFSAGTIRPDIDAIKIMHRNYSEESSWGSLKEEEIDSESGDAQTKILEQLKSPGSQQSLQNLDNREDDKATTGLNMRGKN